jgi:hypothetical protein
MSFRTRLTRAYVVDADHIVSHRPAEPAGVLTMRLLVHLELHQLAALDLNSVTGPLADNLRAAALWQKVKSKGYAVSQREV